MSVCDYVALPLDDVTDVLSRADVDDLLTTAVNAALGPDGPRVSVRTTPLESLGRAVARARLTYRAVDRSSPDAQGVGTLIVHVVSSGRESLTELLVSAQVPEEHAGQVATVARCFLAQLTKELSSRGAGSRAGSLG